MGLSTRQAQALPKKRHWQEAHGSQQAGAGGLQLSRVATQGVGGGGRATFFIEAFFCRGDIEDCWTGHDILRSSCTVEVQDQRPLLRCPLMGTGHPSGSLPSTPTCTPPSSSSLPSSDLALFLDPTQPQF